MRARLLKPGFFRNEDLAKLDPHIRLLFIGLWCIADREGRLEDRPLRIRADVFPYENVDVEAGLSSLQKAAFLERYEIDGVKYIQILAFKKHQNAHCREPASEIPAPCSHHVGTMPNECYTHAGPAEYGIRNMANKVVYHVGYFRTPEEAHEAYMRIKARLHLGGRSH